MEFNLFIIPMTLIIVELAKGLGNQQKVSADRQCGARRGRILGGAFSFYYGADLFTHVVEGIIYAATASGIYDVAKSLKGVK